MNRLQAAFAAEHALRRAVEHLYDLEYRVNRRFQLWFRGDDDPLVAKLLARIAPRHDMRIEHEQAEWRRDRLWDECARHMPPSAEMVDEQVAARRATGRNGRLAVIGVELRLALLRCYEINLSSEERQTLVDGVASGLISSDDDALALLNSMRVRQ